MQLYDKGMAEECAHPLKAILSAENELTSFHQHCVARGSCAVIPESLQARVLQMAHDGHPVQMKQRCREAIWWPGMNTHIEQFVHICEACAISGKSVKPTQPPMQPIEWPQCPRTQLQIDTAGEFQITPQSHRFMNSVHDLQSKWPEVPTTSVVISTTVIRTLQELFTRWGIAEVIITDNGPHFTSFQFNEFLQHLGIKHCLTALYNPQSNGGIERFSRVMKGVKASMAEGNTFPPVIK